MDVRHGIAPDPDGGIPVDLTLFADGAYERIRERYPSFAYDFARTTGLLDLPGWSEMVAAYWLIPFSERSALRTHMIEDLYHLLLLDAAIQKHRPAELHVMTDDERLGWVIARMAATHGVSVSSAAVPGSLASAASEDPISLAQVWHRILRLTRGILRVVRGRWRLLRTQWKARRLLRGQAVEVMDDRAGEDRLVAFYTRYPVLWERFAGGLRERNFGTFPDYLARNGFKVVYPAVLSANWEETQPNFKAIRSEARDLGVVFLEPLLSVWEFFRVYMNVSHAFRYLLWRWRNAREPVCFDGIDVRELLLRELDPEFLYGTELLTNCGRAYAFRRFCRMYSPRVIFHPFEYQPMERALWAGVRAAGTNTTIVGTQGGMFTSNWLGFFYAPGEVAVAGAIPKKRQSPLPDYVVAYGSLSHAVLARQYDPDRVLLPGAIRYPDIQANSGDTQPSDRSSLPDLPDGTRILVACSASREETSLLLRAAADLARARPDVFLLLKFHFHNPMHADWESLARALGLSRYRICDTDLADLLKESRAVLLGSSSVVVEAIALGCMPVVFQPPDRYSYSPALDMPEAVFLCSDLFMVARSLEECMERTGGYWERRRTWPEALEKMAFRLDGCQDERLLAQLRERSVL